MDMFLLSWSSTPQVKARVHEFKPESKLRFS